MTRADPADRTGPAGVSDPGEGSTAGGHRADRRSQQTARSEGRSTTGPIGRPGRDDAGEVVVNSLRCLRRQPMLYLLLSIAPTLFGALALLAVPVLIGQSMSGRLDWLPDIALGALLGVIVIILVLARMRFQAALIAATTVIADGGSTSFAGAMSDSRGFLGRALAVVLLTTGATLLAVTPLVWLFGRSGSQTPSVLLLVGVGVATVLVLTLLGAHLYPLQAVFSVETERRGPAALSRAWQLTTGRFRQALTLLVVLNALTLLCLTVAVLPVALPAAVNGDLGTLQLARTLLPWTVLTVILCGAVMLLSTALLATARALFHRDVVARQPVTPTLNWAPPTTAPAGGLTVSGNHSPGQWGQPQWGQPQWGQQQWGQQQSGQRQWPSPQQPTGLQQWPSPQQHGVTAQHWPGQGGAVAPYPPVRQPQPPYPPYPGPQGGPSQQWPSSRG